MNHQFLGTGMLIILSANCNLTDWLEKFCQKRSKKQLKGSFQKNDDLPLLTAYDKEQMQSNFKNDLEKLERLIGKYPSKWQL